MSEHFSVCMIVASAGNSRSFSKWGKVVYETIGRVNKSDAYSSHFWLNKKGMSRITSGGWMSQKCLQGAESQIQHPADANGHTVVIYQSCGFIYRLERYGRLFFLQCFTASFKSDCYSSQMWRLSKQRCLYPHKLSQDFKDYRHSNKSTDVLSVPPWPLIIKYLDTNISWWHFFSPCQSKLS